MAATTEEIVKTERGDFRVVTSKVSDVSAERSEFLDGMEARFQEQLESRGDVKQRYRCAAATYLARPRLYGNGHNSYLFECYDIDGQDPIAAYVYSQKPVFFESEQVFEGFGYLARVAPSHQAKGLGTLLWNIVTTAIQTNGCALGTAFIARDNFPQLKVMVRNSTKTGVFPVAEQAIYLMNSTQFRDTPGLSSVASLNAQVERIDSADAFAALCQQVYGREGLCLVDPKELLSLSQHQGHYVARCGEDLAAGISIWKPDYALVVDPESKQSEYWLFYNPWSQGGAAGEQLLLSLVLHLLHDSACPIYTLISICRTDIKEASAEEIPEFFTNSFEALVAPHATGVEIEVLTNGFVDYPKSKQTPKVPMPSVFIDPRDFSSLLTFHPVSEQQHSS